MPLGTGGMIALIGCAEEDVENVMLNAEKYGKIFIANDNSKGQIVLSGEISAVDYISSNARVRSKKSYKVASECTIPLRIN